MEEYLSKISTAYSTRIKILFINEKSKKFDLKFTPIELGMVLDNIV